MGNKLKFHGKKIFYSLIVIFLTILALGLVLDMFFIVYPLYRFDILSLFLSIIIAIGIVEYTFLKTTQYEHNRNLEDLIEEIDLIRHNVDFHVFLSNIFKDEYALLNLETTSKATNTWLLTSTSYGLSYGLYQKSSDSLTHGIPGYVTQYLPSKAYYKFMERGLYENIRKESKWLEKRELYEPRLRALMHIYDYAIEFSQKSQELEQMAHNLGNDENYEMNINLIYAEITCLFDDFKPKIDSELSKFNPDNLKGLELSIYELISDYVFRWVRKHFLMTCDVVYA